MRAIAINIGANTNEPGFRGPVFPDGSFEYIPIPESAPTAEGVPTYGDLAPHLRTPIPDEIADTPVHLDPEFPEYPFCERYSYGDEHGVKAGPLADLSAGDFLYFYATLSVAETDESLPPRPPKRAQPSLSTSTTTPTTSARASTPGCCWLAIPTNRGCTTGRFR